MSIQVPYTSTQISQTILNGLSNSGVRQTTAGGKARAWADAVASISSSSELRVFNMITQSFLTTATGKNLDFIGSIYGVIRIPAQDASSDMTDDNFQFYVASGTFGDINNGNDIIIPTGTAISDGNPSDPFYTVDYETALSATSSLQNISVTCSVSGSGGNSAANTYIYSNFTNYVNSIYGSLLVTNNYGVVSGRDVEDDDSYRYRINLKLQGTGGAARADLTFSLLQVTGVQDIVFESLAGTFNVYVYGISPNVSIALLQQVQAIINANTAFPLTGLALAPDLIGISLETTVTPIKGLSLAEQNAAMAAAATAAASYINNLGVGNTLVINEISDVMMNASQNILDIGSPNKPLQNIFIWRDRTDNTRYSRFLVTDYTPALGERVVVEQSIPNPIALSISNS